MKEIQTSRDCAEQRAEVVISKRARPVHPVVTRIAENLAGIEIMRIVKVTSGFLSASSETYGARTCPVTKPGHPTAVGVSLILDEEHRRSSSTRSHLPSKDAQRGWSRQ